MACKRKSIIAKLKVALILAQTAVIIWACYPYGFEIAFVACLWFLAVMLYLGPGSSAGE
jgi:hypothetical protein